MDVDERAFDVLRRALRREHGIQAVRERRGGHDRRGSVADSREWDAGEPCCRRAAERRTPVLAAPPVELPSAVRGHAGRLSFVERLVPDEARREDLVCADLVARFQAGDVEVFAALYARWFDRIYGYLRVILRDGHAAEDATQEVFARAYRALPRYRPSATPVRAWLFRIARNHALDLLRATDVEPFAKIEESTDPRRALEPELAAGWVSDADLATLVERLPLAQRQVLTLRFMLDLDTREIAAILDRSQEDVRALQSRALRFLCERLAAVRAHRSRELVR